MTRLFSSAFLAFLLSTAAFCQSVSSTVSVLVSATDNVGVVRVELYVDGVLYGSSGTAPFTIKWSTRKVATGAHALQSKAYDAAGNL